VKIFHFKFFVGCLTNIPLNIQVHMNKTWYLVLLSSISLFAAKQQDAPVSPQVVEQQLEDAEAEFQRAKKMFNPWYTGPLLAPSAHILPPGMFNVQPYLYITNNHAKYDESGHAHDIPNLIS
jgi:hypothetical protein